MELKPQSITFLPSFSTLLIVPYGIETNPEKFLPDEKRLLIVPYGIETGKPKYY